MGEAYSIFDKSGMGSVTASDFRSALQKLGENVEVADMEDQLREFDSDRNIVMGVTEWNRMLNNTSTDG
jgi:Ca2+-binding EF-hand superfamily protein